MGTVVSLADAQQCTASLSLLPPLLWIVFRAGKAGDEDGPSKTQAEVQTSCQQTRL